MKLFNARLASWHVAAGGGAYHDGDDGVSVSGHTVAGLTYLFDFDVFKNYVLPYAQVGVGASVFHASREQGKAAETTVHPLFELGLGLDVLHGRSLSYGIKVSIDGLIPETAIGTASVRLTWRWGFSSRCRPALAGRGEPRAYCSAAGG